MPARFRRFAYAARLPLAGVLPLWVLLGYAIWGGGLAGLVGVVLLAPLVAAGEIALAVLFSARPWARRERMLSVPDAALITAYQLAVIGFGFFGPATAWFGVAALAAALVGLWLGTRRLADDVRLQAQRMFGVVGARPPAERAPLDAGEYVVIKKH